MAKIADEIQCNLAEVPQKFKGEVGLAHVILTGRGFCNVSLNDKTEEIATENLEIFVPVKNLKGWTSLKAVI